MPGGKYCDTALGEVSMPNSFSWCVRSLAVIEPLLLRSRTAKDSRMVWRWWGGIADRGSEDCPLFRAGRAVLSVLVRAYVGLAVDAFDIEV